MITINLRDGITETKQNYLKRKEEKLTQKLEECLSEILSRKLNHWTEKTSGFEDSWNIYSKEEFYKLNDKYPVPKP